MTFTKKIGRARQWAGEKMGAEAKTAQSDEFQELEAEMGFRQTGTRTRALTLLFTVRQNRR